MKKEKYKLKQLRTENENVMLGDHCIGVIYSKESVCGMPTNYHFVSNRLPGICVRDLIDRNIFTLHLKIKDEVAKTMTMFCNII